MPPDRKPLIYRTFFTESVGISTTTSRYFIDAEHALVLLPAISKFEWTSWAETMKHIFAEPGFRPGLGFLTDRRAMKEGYARPDMERIIQFFTAHHAQVAGSSWAAVTGGPGPVHDSLSVMAMLCEASGIRIRPFTAFPPAIEWVAPQTDPAERQRYVDWLEANTR